MAHVSLERLGNQGSGISAGRHDLGIGPIDLIDYHDLLLHCQPPQCLGGRTTATFFVSCLNLDHPSNSNFSCNAFNDVASQDEVVETVAQEPVPAMGQGAVVHCPMQSSRSDLGGYRTPLKTSTLTKIRRPITTLAGVDVIKAWLEVVKFHAYCWSTGLERNEPNLWKVLYDMGLKTNGCRILRIIVLKKLLQLTTLAGQDFIKAWLETAKFHAYLWKKGCEHGDPSLWNLMYDSEKKCGVLSDFDLSILRDDPRIPGTDRTGTIPFMAVELLTAEYWRGEVTRLYRHELEALAWILPFVFLRYQDGKPCRNTEVEKWMTSDYKDCKGHKMRFYAEIPQHGKLCQPDFKDHWPLVTVVFWLVNNAIQKLFAHSRSNLGDDVALVWPHFVQRLKSVAARNTPNLDYVTQLVDELELDSLFPTTKQKVDPQ